jgi:hypothetical protein
VSTLLNQRRPSRLCADHGTVDSALPVTSGRFGGSLCATSVPSPAVVNMFTTLLPAAVTTTAEVAAGHAAEGHVVAASPQILAAACTPLREANDSQCAMPSSNPVTPP